MSAHLREVIAYSFAGFAALCVLCMFAAPLVARFIPRDDEETEDTK